MYDVINFFMVRRQIGKHPHLVYTSENSQDFVTKGQKKIIVHDLCPAEPHQIGKKVRDAVVFSQLLTFF